jgi:hypothetical protein
MMRLKAYRQMDIHIRSYQRPQEAEMTSTVEECLQGIQTTEEATVHYKNGLGNPAMKNEHFTRADDAYTRYNMHWNALWRWYY